LLLVGCEPLTTEEQMGLSAPVAAAVDEAADVVVSLVTNLQSSTVTAGVS
jgi:hydrogenase maturation protease